MPIYDRISPIYDWMTVSERQYSRQALALLDVQPDETLLEIGCGTGQALKQQAPQMGSEGRLIGLDLSAGMLRQAQGNLNDTAVSLLRGSGLKLPLAANCCDAIFLSFTLELFDLEEQHQLLAEIRRVLGENGRLALVTLSTHEQTTPSSIYWSLHEAFPGVVDCRPVAVPPLLAAAGFSITQQDNRLMFGLPLSILLAAPV